MFKEYRYKLYLLFFGLILVIIISRLFYLQIYQYHFFQKKLENQVKRVIEISPHRGNIYSKDEMPLAITRHAYSSYAIPIKIKDKKIFAKKVSEVLKIDAGEIYQKIDNKLWFIWLKRKCSNYEYLKLQSLKLEGLDFIKEEKRVYPFNNLAAEIIGFVGIDNQGLGGIEFQYDSFLSGKPGKIVLDIDPRGYRLISGIKEIIEPTYDGGNIYTTLDSYLQHITKKYLKEGVINTQAMRGSAMVLDPNTGEILAMANYPDFNPNNWYNTPFKYIRNSCINDLYEPGSVFKIVTLASVLNENLVSQNTIINVPTQLKIANHTIKEAHSGSPGIHKKTVSDILVESLNVGTSILATMAGKDTFFKYVDDFGFGKTTGIELPAEAKGIMREKEYTTKMDLMMMSFGQSVSVTPLQMAMAVGVVANGGYLLQPRIISYLSDKNNYHRYIPKKVKQQVISENIAEELRTIMTKVVDEGTGKVTQIPGYSVAGKTGTAQKPNPKGPGYLAGHYIASFVGFLPANKPQILIIVIIDSPKTSIWGSTTAAPIFKRIAIKAIDYYNIKPDRVNTKNNVKIDL